MKIVCNKNEFAKLVHWCTVTQMQGDCGTCLFKNYCAAAEEPNGIEDYCELKEE